MKLFNRSAAVQYALKWALARNPDFPDFSSEAGGGGDCTNFVSQVMLAGGWSFGMKPWDLASDWWSKTGPRARSENAIRNASRSWAAAHNFRTFLDKSGRATLCARDDMELADIVLVRIGRQTVHAMVVTEAQTGRKEHPTALNHYSLSYHSRDTRNRPLWQIERQYDDKSVTIEYWKVFPWVFQERQVTIPRVA